MIKGIKEIVDSIESGRILTSYYRKNPTQTTTAGYWFDLSMSPGSPVAKYWFGTPLKATPVSSDDGGIYHGDISGYDKYLYKTTIVQSSFPVPLQYYLFDYLLYYPLIDDGTTDEQIMDNTDGLTRYTDGEGVKMIAVSLASRTGGQDFYVKYTNSRGETGRTSGTVKQNASAALGQIITCWNTTNINALFIPLQNGDTGVRSVESVQMLGTDVGLFAIILVKPIASFQGISTIAPVEINYCLTNGTFPKIHNNAFLNYCCSPNGTVASTLLMMDISFIWG